MNFNIKQLFQKHNVKGLSINSQSIKKNQAFFAFKGQNVDGNNFINDALSKGAALVITKERKSTVINPNKVIYVEDIWTTLYEAIEIFYPSKPQTMLAVTGTNGKSSVVSYTGQLYSLLGQDAASIGTIGLEVFSSNSFTRPNVQLNAKSLRQDKFNGEFTQHTKVHGYEHRQVLQDALVKSVLKNTVRLTTLDYLSFRKIAHDLAKNDIKFLAFEASSHGLDQKRLGEIKVDIGCFTSFSHDHLDYHHTKEAYLLAKLKLFTDHLLPSSIAILNSDIKEIEFIKDYLNKHNVKYLMVGSKGDIKITKIHSSIRGQHINFTFNNKEYNFNTPIIGSFQASNLLFAALSVHHHTSFVFDKIVSALTKIRAVKGRMERVKNTNIFVDYAHTPEALAKILTELKNIKIPGSKLSVIFGCGGNRDTTKRRLMGKIAAQIADNVIVTDDNPRYENPSLIRAEIISAIGKTSYVEIENREEAIKYGINNLQQHDILLIAGKGHENYQIAGDKKLPFNDTEIVEKYI